MESRLVPKLLLVSNVPSNARDEEVVALVKKYAPQLECIDLWRVNANGGRPAMLLSFMHTGLDSLEELSRMLSGMYWRGHTLAATTMPRYASAG